jgi:ankyrin repeat protein
MKKLSFIVGASLILMLAGSLKAIPVRGIALALKHILDKELVERIMHDAINGNISKRQAFANVKKLVDQGAQINAIDPKTGESALTVAAWFSTPEVVEYLLKKGANPNHQDNTEFQKFSANFGRTAMHAAATRESTEFIHLLLLYGAQLNVPDKLGRLPIEYATQKACIDNAVKLAMNGSVVPLSAVEDLKYCLRWASDSQERERILQALAICSGYMK